MRWEMASIGERCLVKNLAPDPSQQQEILFQWKILLTVLQKITLHGWLYIFFFFFFITVCRVCRLDVDFSFRGQGMAANKSLLTILNFSGQGQAKINLLTDNPWVRYQVLTRKHGCSLASQWNYYDFSYFLIGKKTNVFPRPLCTPSCQPRTM